MEDLIKILIKRLVSKGMELTCIPSFIRNLANTIAANPNMTFEDLNRHLKMLGWQDFELDFYTLHLIIAAFETDTATEPAYWLQPDLGADFFRRMKEDAEQMAMLSSAKSKTYH
ncbi:MAG: hypothetical protein JW821_16780 [Deltaproteobacteria bacterium]|nr:hypothetical protein [Deltaproteobacteria bacterium]